MDRKKKLSIWLISKCSRKNITKITTLNKKYELVTQ